VVFGHGPHFTAGLDLPQWAPVFAQGRFPDLPADSIDPFGLDESKRVRKPVVVAAQGVSYTVAMELMLAADVRVAAEDCRFAQLEVLRGFFPCGGATVRLMQEIGWGNAMRYLLTGEEFGAAEAHRMGFVQQVVRARPAARGRGRRSRLGSRARRRWGAGGARLVAPRAHQGDVAALAALFPALGPIMASADAREAVQAFVERRQAEFRGR
jgi:enoyl-CoA hydratase/carnithine racemase